MPRAETDPVDVDGLAARGAELSLSWPLGAFTRLVERLLSAEGSATAALRFHRADRRAVVEGRVQTELRVQCQRCLAPLTLALDVPLKIAFVADERAAEDVPDEYDPSVAPEGRVTLAALVEDELLLSLPLVARHADAQDCDRTGVLAPPALAPTPTESDTVQRPFANLRDWLKQ